MVVQRYLLSFVAVRIDAAALDFLVRKLLALPMTYFNTRRTGDIQRRLEGIRQRARVSRAARRQRPYGACARSPRPSR